MFFRKPHRSTRSPEGTVMFVVAAELTVDASDHDKFLPHVLENARITRSTETGCRQFDVTLNPDKPGEFFLYEVYDDRAAFDTHQASAHLKAFRANAGAMLKNRNVRFFKRVAP
jgi:quinol monooxygenase YgiN